MSVTPLKDCFLVSADEEKNSKTKSGLFLDVTWNKYLHAVQDGIIEEIPLSISKKYRYDVKLKKGDKIFFHHFTIQPDNYLLDEGRKLYKADYFNIYCIIRGGVPVVLEDWVLATAIPETEEDITKKYGSLTLYTKAVVGKKRLLAKAEYISKQAEEQGLKVGDTIIYKTDADYEMMVEGKEYYRMKLINIAAIIRKGNMIDVDTGISKPLPDMIIPLRDEVAIKTNFKEETVRASGIILVNLKPERTQQAKIYSKGVSSEYSVRDEILYLYGTGVRIEHEGKKFCILRGEEVLGVMQEK